VLDSFFAISTFCQLSSSTMRASILKCSHMQLEHQILGIKSLTLVYGVTTSFPVHSSRVISLNISLLISWEMREYSSKRYQNFCVDYVLNIVVCKLSSPPVSWLDADQPSYGLSPSFKSRLSCCVSQE
jgi:hypothetical protein